MPVMIEEVDDKEFDDLIAEQRHKELTSTLKSIAKVLSQKDDTGINGAIDKQTTAIKGFVDAIKSLPAVTVEHNEDKVTGAVDKMCESILQQQEKTNSLLEEIIIQSKIKKEWSFTMVRDNYSDFTKEMIAKQIK